jgi:two-component sensor histidine kinase
VLITAPEPRSRPALMPQAQLALSLAPKPHEVQRVRHEVQRTLAIWGCADSADEVLVVVSELITNAVRHAPCPEINFVATYGEGVLLLEVDDGSTAPPIPQRHLADAESGRGLDIVQSLVSDWGWTPRADGMKTTWAVIQVPARNAFTRPELEEIA